MKARALATMLAVFPAVLAAQQSSATASASASAPASVSIPANYSAEGRAKIESAFKGAQEKNLPDEPMRQRLAEGQVKGATEAQVVAVIERTQARLEASQSALINAGRATPQPAEIASGELALARGATTAQLEAVVKQTAEGQPAVFNSLNASAAVDLLSGVNGAVDAAAGAKTDGKPSITGAVKGAVTTVVPPKPPKP